MRRKILSIISIVMIVVMTFPAFAAVVQGNFAGYFDYRQNLSHTSISRWTASGSNVDIVVPSEINGIAVTTITATEPNNTIETLVLPDSITTAITFEGWQNLREINIPPNMRIGESMFEDCISLEQVSFASGGGRSLTIGHRAFYGCDSLEEITLPASFSNAAYDSFWSKNIQNIYVDEANTKFIDIDGVLCWVPESSPGGGPGFVKIEAIPVGRTGEYIVPDEVDYVDFEAYPSFGLERIIFHREASLYGMSSPGEEIRDILEIGMRYPTIVCYRNSRVARQAIKYGLPYEYIDGVGGGSSNNDDVISDSEPAIPETEGVWNEGEHGWQLRLPDGSFLKNSWAYKANRWYYLDENGYIKIGWMQNSDGRWYYFDISGAMLTDATTPDGYYVDVDGSWQ